MVDVVDYDEFSRLLDSLEGAWRRLGAPVMKYLRPGLLDDQIDELMAPTGLMLPDEMRWWWRWHDGADNPDSGSDDEREIGPGGWLHLSLTEALELQHRHLSFYDEIVAAGSRSEAESTWHSGLFPLSHRVARPNDVLAANTLVHEHAPAPVCLRAFMGIEPDVGAESVSALVNAWVDLLESGRYSVVDGFFDTDPPGLIEGDSRFRWFT